MKHLVNINKFTTHFTNLNLIKLNKNFNWSKINVGDYISFHINNDNTYLNNKIGRITYIKKHYNEIIIELFNIDNPDNNPENGYKPFNIIEPSLIDKIDTKENILTYVTAKKYNL